MKVQNKNTVNDIQTSKTQQTPKAKDTQYQGEKVTADTLGKDPMAMVGRSMINMRPKGHRMTPEQIEAAYSVYPDTSQNEIKKALIIDDIPPMGTSRDARGYDISGLPLTQKDFKFLIFDKTTIMTDKQKEMANVYLEAAKNPGLGISDLHAQGITGKGVKMAIIDSPLVKHEEYASNIVYLEDMTDKNDPLKDLMHGSGVLSIAAGKTIGVAPEADVVYIAAQPSSTKPEDVEAYITNIEHTIKERGLTSGSLYDYYQKTLKQAKEHGVASTNQPYANAINKILDMNKDLPDNEKVSVVSISFGFNDIAPGFDEVQKAIQRAKEEGVLIASTRIDEHYHMDVCGANREMDADIDSPESYQIGSFLREMSESGNLFRDNGDNILLVPMDNKTTANCIDGNSYKYDGDNCGMSWAMPWFSGMYVLAKQVKPTVTPEEFWKVALETSDKCHNHGTGTYVGQIINPQKLIETLQG